MSDPASAKDSTGVGDRRARSISRRDPRREHKRHTRLSRGASASSTPETDLAVRPRSRTPVEVTGGGNVNNAKALSDQSLGGATAGTTGGGNVNNAKASRVRDPRSDTAKTADEVRAENTKAFRIRDLQGKPARIAEKTHALYYSHLYHTLTREELDKAADPSQGSLRDQHLITIKAPDDHEASKEFHEHVDNDKLKLHVFRHLSDNYHVRNNSAKEHAEGKAADSYKDFGALNPKTVTARGTEENYRMLYHQLYPNKKAKLRELQTIELREKWDDSTDHQLIVGHIFILLIEQFTTYKMNPEQVPDQKYEADHMEAAWTSYQKWHKLRS